ncbi:MAG: glycine dehydrogenase (aminomethyl-transferring) [Omnitrophica bacterium RIFCSPLOWO2_01_FULL_50_24]|nr:MAG: glycine dehydrogenase (aminomethyl-transferring) [Omnitrophica bacterium RIFCSPLOWO2_01_FULL_50_24]
MSYFPLTKEDQAEMLETIGVEHFGQLLQAIPTEIRNPKIDLPPALSELEAQRWFQSLADLNATSKTHLSFLGAGCYEHFIPSIVRHVTGRGEFYTSYTPYQPEASQGTLQALFEYQGLMCELTGMDVANGSHYDGASALAESVLMGLHHTGRTKAVLCESVHPEFREVVKTYLTGTRFEIETTGFHPDFRTNLEELKKKLTADVACVAIQSPNFFGLVEDLTELETLVHQNGSLLILVSHPLSFGFYKSAMEWGADVACGEAQPLGISPSFGGPWLGYIAVTRALVRRIPGRLAGVTTDESGRRAFCLTLQAREQHIRREKASSNICTNQALCALAAAVYLASIGKKGIRRVAELNLERALYLRKAVGALKRVEAVTTGSVFNEFVVRFEKPVSAVNAALFEKGIIGGLDLVRYYPKLRNQMLVCATETKSKDDLDRFVSALKEVTA